MMGSYHKACWQVKYACQLINVNKFIDSANANIIMAALSQKKLECSRRALLLLLLLLFADLYFGMCCKAFSFPVLLQQFVF